MTKPTSEARPGQVSANGHRARAGEPGWRLNASSADATSLAKVEMTCRCEAMVAGFHYWALVR